MRIKGSPRARPVPPTEREVVEQAFVGILRVVAAQLQGDDQIVIANGRDWCEGLSERNDRIVAAHLDVVNHSVDEIAMENQIVSAIRLQQLRMASVEPLGSAPDAPGGGILQAP